jgi:hypothetical protein
MRITIRLSALLGALVLTGAAAQADTKPKQPAPADAASQAAIASLAKGPIHDLSVAVDKVNTRLDLLETEVVQVEKSLAATDLPGLALRQADSQAAAAEMKIRQDGLEGAVAGAQARIAAEAAAADSAIRALTLKQSGADARLIAVQQSWEERIDGAEKSLAAQIASAAAGREQAAARAAQAQDRAGLAAVAVLAALIAAAICIEWRGRMALRGEVSLAMAGLGGELRQVLATAPPAGKGVVAPPDWSHLETRLRRLVEWGENGKAPPARAAAAVHESEKVTVSHGPADEPSVASRHLWPADFLDPESPLSRWRFLLENHLADEEHPALQVLTQLLNVRALLRAPAAPSAEFAAALFRLSESLHAYWHSLTDLSAEDRQQASSAWLQGMRALIAGTFRHVDLREIRPGTLVDPDMMHAVVEGPGNHLNVADVFSWAVVDRSGDRFRVLHRAQIAST